MELIVDPTYPRYTRGEMLSAVHAENGQMTVSAFRDWQAKGLIANASQRHRWTPGTEGSGPGLWSANQRRALIELVRLRDSHRAERGRFDPAPLAQVVVFWWLHHDGVVALPQARKALATWVRPQFGGRTGRLRSEDRLHRAARLLVNMAAPDAQRVARAKAGDLVTNLFWSGRLDEDRLCGAFEELAGSDDQTGGYLKSLAWYLGTVALAAEAVLAVDGRLTDADWDVTRRIVGTTWADYVRHSGLRPPESDAEQVETSTRSVLLGLGQRIAGRGVRGPSL